jgi:hypothetical protein
MFIYREGKSQLEVSLEVAHVSLQHLDPNSDEYGVVLDRIARLEKMRDAKRRPSISPDTIVMAATNLLGILLILNYERTEIVTTKALGFVSKAR